MTRIALLSDIHGNLPALEAVADDLRHRNIGLTVSLGDNLSSPLWPLETARFLMAAGWPALAGNHERQVLTLPPERQNLSDRFTRTQLGAAELAWLAGLPSGLMLEAQVLLCHGSPHRDIDYLLESIADGHTRLASEQEIRQRLQHTRAAVIACGHTHIPRNLMLDGMLLVNPGSVGLPAYDDDHPPHCVENGSPHARYAVIECRHGHWLSEHYAIPYDHEHAARRAEAQQRADWAYALRHGRVLPSSN